MKTARTILVFLVLVPLCLAAPVRTALADGPSARPNILLIVADDLGYTDLGAFGSEIATPRLDALALAGIRFSNFHTGRACQQTRTMLMASSGTSAAIELRPQTPPGTRNNLLRMEWAILPELLRDAGYQNFMVGKWDLGLEGDYRPSRRGFDRSFVLLSGGASHFAEYFWRESLTYEDEGRRLELADLPEDFYSTRFYTDRMLEYLESREEGRPWFAYMAYTAPHWPLQVPDEWLDRYAGRYDGGYEALRRSRLAGAASAGVIPAGAAPEAYQPLAPSWDGLGASQQRRYARAQEIYASMIEYLDASIGRIVDYLDEAGELDNTVIFFMSDNGASAAEEGVGPGDQTVPATLPRDNELQNYGRIGSFIDHGTGFAEAASAPFKYFKGNMSEGGIRNAAFIHYPASIEPGAVSPSFASALDVLPTFLEIAGTRHPGVGDYKGRQINDARGRSMWPHLTGRNAAVHDAGDAAGWSNGSFGALVRGRFKIVNQGAPGASAPTSWRLYDIEADPSEATDLAADLPELLAELIAEWNADWR